jgi:uncharacterized peroxidase-related enzyme
LPYSRAGAFEDNEEADLFVHHLASDWRQAALDEADQALCAFAVKLTKTPEAMNENDILVLRQCGFDDQAIHDATQVIAYFNYINRIADALHVEQEEFIRPWEQSAQRLIGG